MCYTSLYQCYTTHTHTHTHTFLLENPLLKHLQLDFLGGTVVKNPPASAGDMGSSPGPGKSHMPQSN